MSKQSGFTLVELLIVIVIIGILAGVVIGVLNPIQQQNRAKDGATRSQLDKLALSGKSLFVSSPRATNRTPTEAEFYAGIGNVAAPTTGTACTANTPANSGGCSFQITGQTLPATCAANGYNGTGTGSCNFYYYRAIAANSNSFRIAAMGAAQPVVLFVYEYTEDTSTGTIVEGFYSCPTGYNPATTAAAGTCTNLN